MKRMEGLVKRDRDWEDGGGETESRTGMKAARKRSPGEAVSGRELSAPEWIEICAIEFDVKACNRW